MTHRRAGRGESAAWTALDALALLAGRFLAVSCRFGEVQENPGRLPGEASPESRDSASLGPAQRSCCT